MKAQGENRKKEIFKERKKERRRKDWLICQMQ